MKIKRSKRTRVTVSILVLVVGGVAYAWTPIVTAVVGTPTSPATVTLSVPYTVNVAAQVPTGSADNLCCAQIWGDITPTGPWTYKANLEFTGMGPAGNHTFDVVNQDTGTYCWTGAAYCTASDWSGLAASAVDGGYTTP